jgi:hypothetical protein
MISSSVLRSVAGSRRYSISLGHDSGKGRWNAKASSRRTLILMAASATSLGRLPSHGDDDDDGLSGPHANIRHSELIAADMRRSRCRRKVIRMPRINWVEERDAQGRLAELFEASRAGSLRRHGPADFRWSPDHAHDIAVAVLRVSPARRNLRWLDSDASQDRAFAGLPEMSPGVGPSHRRCARWRHRTCGSVRGNREPRRG